MSETYKGYTIRNRDRRGRPAEGYGDYQTWNEWQVVGARGNVLGRFDFAEQAKAFVDRELV